jgi:hypothetical protein
MESGVNSGDGRESDDDSDEGSFVNSTSKGSVSLSGSGEN